MKTQEKIRMIVLTGLLVALTILLDRPPLSFSTLGLKIGFAFVPVVISAILYGPVIAGITYGLADFIAANLFPTGPYFPGFTFCAVLMGVTYGLFLYKKSEYFKKSKIAAAACIVIPALINCMIGLFINTAWVAMLYGKLTYWGWFSVRISQYVLIVPLNIVLIPVLLNLCEKIKKKVYSEKS